MRLLYQNKEFANYWNERAGREGEVYKRLILDPLMFKISAPLQGKTILELGCGNGYRGPQFISRGAKRLILMDISKYNINFAREKCPDKKAEFIVHDATKKWPVKSASCDIVFSTMMLNEISNIKTPIHEVYRVLQNHGKFIFSITHPSFDLYVYAQERAGLKSKKIKGLGNYFRRGYTKFLLGINTSHTNRLVDKKYNKDFELEHYQRPLSDYFNQLVEAGFTVDRIDEPPLNKKILATNPKFKVYLNHPVGLVFSCTK